MKQIVCALVLISLQTACSAEETGLPASSLLIDPKQPQISDLMIGMEQTEVAQLKYEIDWQKIEIEGDPYDIALMTIAPVSFPLKPGPN